MPKFRKKPVVIEAVQVTPNTLYEVAEWCVARVVKPDSAAPRYDHIVIRTLEGDMTAMVGDYVIKGVQGEFYPCKPDIFAATYEVEDAPSGFEYLDIRIPVPVGRQWTHTMVAGLRLDAAAAVERAVSERRRTER